MMNNKIILKIVATIVLWTLYGQTPRLDQEQ